MFACNWRQMFLQFLQAIAQHPDRENVRRDMRFARLVFARGSGPAVVAVSGCFTGWRRREFEVKASHIELHLQLAISAEQGHCHLCKGRLRVGFCTYTVSVEPFFPDRLADGLVFVCALGRESSHYTNHVGRQASRLRYPSRW